MQKMTTTQSKELFLTALKGQNYSPKTLRAYSEERNHAKVYSNGEDEFEAGNGEYNALIVTLQDAALCSGLLPAVGGEKS